jgi:hypothetical protein
LRDEQDHRQHDQHRHHRGEDPLRQDQQQGRPQRRARQRGQGEPGQPWQLAAQLAAVADDRANIPERQPERVAHVRRDGGKPTARSTGKVISEPEPTNASMAPAGSRR